MLQNFINGEWIDSLGNDSAEIANPANGELLGRCPLGTTEDVDRAVRAAADAFACWRQTPAPDRIQYLFRLKSLLEEHLTELVELCTSEHGKTIVESRGDVRRAIQMVETACSIPSLMMGKYFEDIAGGIDCQTVHRPLGVFAAVTPFNFPVMVPFWFWPFAVACGNTFIVKPSERVPLSQIKVFELIRKAGFPKGVVNLVLGGKETVEALCRHPQVRGVSFVGSTGVAKRVYELCGAFGKRSQALGGAKNFMVVLPDAVLDSSIRTSLESIVGCAGQRCLAGSVVLVAKEVYRDFKEGMVSKAADIIVGDGRDPQTQMGPLISRAAVERVKGLIQSAIDEGAEILLDGRQTLGSSPGYFLRPTVLGGITRKMRIAREEVFGPVICLAEVSSLEQAIDWINGSNFGNTTSLFTASGAAARKFCYEVDPSMIGINIGVPAPMSFFSFGGCKDSFFGDVKAHGSSAIEFYTDMKTTIARWHKNASIW